MRRQQAQQCACECTLSATGLSQNADDLTGANLDADAIQSANWVAVFRMVCDRQILDLGKIRTIHQATTPLVRSYPQCLG